MGDDTHPLAQWSVNRADIPATGLQLRLALDDGAGLVALARQVGVDRLAKVRFSGTAQLIGRDMVRIEGQVSAEAVQTCVVSLEPIEVRLSEPIEVTFAPPQPPTPVDHDEEGLDVSGEEPPEDLIHGLADLGRVAAEYLTLAVDPYPRKPGAVFVQPQSEPEDNPFSALKALKKD